MTEQQLKRGNELLGLIHQAKDNLQIWKDAIRIENHPRVLSEGTIYNVHVPQVAFESARLAAIAHYENNILKFESELAAL